MNADGSGATNVTNSPDLAGHHAHLALELTGQGLPATYVFG